MTLELDSNVVYAILATIVVVVLVVNVSKIVWLRMAPKGKLYKPGPYDQETAQTWPTQPQ